MQQFSDVARSWSDTLTTLSIGFLAFFVPLVTKIDSDDSVSISFGAIPKFLQLAEDASTAGAIVLSLMLVSVLLALGSVIIQSGEFQVLLSNRKHGGSIVRRRLEYVSKNSASMLIFSNAYASYRLLCGLGGVLQCYVALLAINALSTFNIQSALLAFFLLNLSFFVIFFLARHSFSAFDWILLDLLESEVAPVPIQSDPSTVHPASGSGAGDHAVDADPPLSPRGGGEAPPK